MTTKLISFANSVQHKYGFTKLSQMGAGVRVYFNHPQFFAPAVHHIFQNVFLNNSTISVGVGEERVNFFDGSGTLDFPTLKKQIIDACRTLEKSLHLDTGELFNYNNITPV